MKAKMSERPTINNSALQLVRLARSELFSGTGGAMIQREYYSVFDECSKSWWVLVG